MSPLLMTVECLYVTVSSMSVSITDGELSIHNDTSVSQFDENLVTFDFGNNSSLNMSSENELSKMSGHSALSDPRSQALLACESAK